MPMEQSYQNSSERVQKAIEHMHKNIEIKAPVGSSLYRTREKIELEGKIKQIIENLMLQNKNVWEICESSDMEE